MFDTNLILGKNICFFPKEYIPVLSRPQVLKNAKTFEWANVYKDHLVLNCVADNVVLILLQQYSDDPNPP